MPFRTTLGPITWIRSKLALHLNIFAKSCNRPSASQVLSCHLRACNYPYWTSYFIPYNSVINDQFGWSHFNWKVEGYNYHVLRVGCYPYIKYHCSKRPEQDLYWQNVLYTMIKCFNLGLPTLVYGLSAVHLAKHRQEVKMPNGHRVTIYFWYPEDRNSPH